MTESDINGGLVQSATIQRWDKAYQFGSDKRYPNLDLVRLDAWFFEKSPGNLLEYGFGCGVNLLHLLDSGYNIDAVDIAPAAKELVATKLERTAISEDRCRLHLLGLGQEKLPFENECFDYITCVSVLSLLGSKKRIKMLLAEFNRVLKSGGKLIVDINDAQSDFARDGIPQGDDQFLYPASPVEGDLQTVTVCLRNIADFRDLVAPFFEIDDEGFSAHKLMHSQIHEFIFCCHKK